jgi:hypothetical protein
MPPSSGSGLLIQETKAALVSPVMIAFVQIKSNGSEILTIKYQTMIQVKVEGSSFYTFLSMNTLTLPIISKFTEI